MSIFVPNKVYLRGILLHYFIQKKSAAEAHRIFVQTYGDNALSDTTCRDWFRRFKNNDFQLEDKERSGAPKKFQDKELEQLLDEDPSQTLSELGKILQVDESTVSKRLKGLGMIQKQGHWVPYELKPRDVERRFGTCELLLQRQKRKGFLTITGDRYRLQLMRLSRALKEKRPLYAQRHDKVILLHDNAGPHVAKSVKTYLETLKWEVLTHPLYSPDIAPSDFHLFKILQVDESTVSKRLKGLGMIQKQGHWVPYELKPREKKRFFASHRIVTGDGKWIHYDNPKRRKSWGKPGHALEAGDRYRLQLMRLSRALKEKRPLYAQRHDKVILLHADRRFHSYEEAQKWIDSWIASKDMSFFRRGIHVLPERWEKVVSGDGQYFK
ncbi:MOS1T transposase, partial [Pseudoatta argentina]